MKLLYAEDERSMSEAVVNILKYHKYTVDTVSNGEAALDFAKAENYDGIILDVIMPKMSGLEVLKKLRESGSRVPVLLLTDKEEIEDKIEGLDTGADDYLTKPFAMGELLARVRAILSRKEDFVPDILRLGNIALNLQNYELFGNGKGFILSKLEYRMMELFMLNRGTYLSTEDLLSKIWGYNTEANIGIVWVYISYLRKRLASIGADVEIKLKRNIGYTLVLKK